MCENLRNLALFGEGGERDSIGANLFKAKVCLRVLRCQLGKAKLGTPECLKKPFLISADIWKERDYAIWTSRIKTGNGYIANIGGN